MVNLRWFWVHFIPSLHTCVGLSTFRLRQLNPACLPVCKLGLRQLSPILEAIFLKYLLWLNITLCRRDRWLTCTKWHTYTPPLSPSHFLFFYFFLCYKMLLINVKASETFCTRRCRIWTSNNNWGCGTDSVERVPTT